MEILRKQRRGALLNFYCYLLWAVPTIIGLAVICGHANNVMAVDVFLLLLSLGVVRAACLLKRLENANTQIKQHIEQHSFRLEDSYPPKFTQSRERS